MAHLGEFTLRSGYSIPQLGFGTWQSAPGQVGEAVYEALKIGYRHLDLATIYRNQSEIAKGIQRAYKEVPGLKREDIFITSKLWNNQHHPEEVEPALDACLKEIGIDYIDLYLIHWPVAFAKGDEFIPLDASSSHERGDALIDETVSIIDTWKAMTQLPKDKVRNIGVANHNVEQLDAIIKGTGVIPAVNQVERHPFLLDNDLVRYCHEKGIHITAYSPLGNNNLGLPLVITHPVIQEVAASASERLGEPVSGANVVIAWAQVGGHSVIPKSVTPSRIRENFKSVTLTDEEISNVESLGKDRKRYNIPYSYYKPRWDINIFNEPEEKAASRRPVFTKRA
ncbi:Aldo/keto reductase [Aspergillus uvarum CBS 121591]|uniref:D-xylose reductase [NAD(P)H] n=1 Tax=Aspergillus uvarum CBS 121591 TaxID=1448315 RepID=A0A319CRM7_9EURO|nr:Aldo/keto reductase [Aspergillus uvarum CBS 121591]PYH87320.1 Aldo/keto reductase [Aspergillus uvarum CBS 121591]